MPEVPPVLTRYIVWRVRKRFVRQVDGLRGQALGAHDKIADQGPASGPADFRSLSTLLSLKTTQRSNTPCLSKSHLRMVVAATPYLSAPSLGVIPMMGEDIRRLVDRQLLQHGAQRFFLDACLQGNASGFARPAFIEQKSPS